MTELKTESLPTHSPTSPTTGPTATNSGKRRGHRERHGTASPASGGASVRTNASCSTAGSTTYGTSRAGGGIPRTAARPVRERFPMRTTEQLIRIVPLRMAAKRLGIERLVLRGGELRAFFVNDDNRGLLSRATPSDACSRIRAERLPPVPLQEEANGKRSVIVAGTATVTDALEVPSDQYGGGKTRLTSSLKNNENINDSIIINCILRTPNLGYAKVIFYMFVKKEKRIARGSISVVIAEKISGRYSELATIGIAQNEKRSRKICANRGVVNG